jgi:pimeloyl-ACP methyl ester carboxylesterase
MDSKGCWKSFLLAALVASSLTVAARADLIILKDGTIISGQVRREGTEMADPYTHEPIFMPKGFFMLDDYARRIYFSPQQVRAVQPKQIAKEEFLYAKEDIKLLGPRNLPPFSEILRAPPFNEKWERTIRLRTAHADIDVLQRIVAITPTMTSVGSAKTYGWWSLYSTRELGVENVRSLLAHHDKYQPKKNETPSQALVRRLKYCDFFVQTGWYEDAERELDKLTKEMPDYKERIEQSRAALGGLQARDGLEEIKRLVAAGQRQGAVEKIKAYKDKYKYASEKMTADLREINSELTTTEGRLKLLRRFLKDLPKDVKGPSAKMFAHAAAAISNELHPDNALRLETFLTQARQYARQKDDGKEPIQKPEKLLSLAVTGWLLGTISSEASADQAQRLWHTRQMLLDYLRTPSVDDRKKMVSEYLNDKEHRLPLDEIAQLIPQLPPADPPETIDAKPAERTIGAGRAAFTYLVQVPPEYVPGRTYPAIILLCDSGEKPADMLKRWGPMASENGYILAAPTWESGGLGRGGYTFSAREHAVVQETLHDLRRRYQVDSDRLFLFGLRQGAVMAFDVGLSHPDQFAGVMTMGGQPELFAERYFRNAQYLPLYVINGNCTGDIKRLRNLFENWVTRGYPTLWVEYKGRGAEWFSPELPNLFDWMREKRRAFPMRQLGTDGNGRALGNELTCLRTGDSHFYWLGSDGIVDRNTTSVERWDARVTPATFFGRIDPVNNEIYLTLRGMKSVTLFLGRSPKGENLIDFDKPLKVTAGLKVLHFNRKVPMSLETMLEELYQTGDKQRLIFARLDFKL